MRFFNDFTLHLCKHAGTNEILSDQLTAVTFSIILMKVSSLGGNRRIVRTLSANLEINLNTLTGLSDICIERKENLFAQPPPRAPIP